MNTHTETVTIHFDDAKTSFSALQYGSSLFITQETMETLRAEGFNMEDATLALHPGEVAGLFDISDFPINFED